MADCGINVPAPHMLEALLGVIGVLATIFVVLVFCAYLVVRFLFVRMAERISEQIAAGIQRLPTEQVLEAGKARGQALVSAGFVAQGVQVSDRVGQRIAALAVSRGVSLSDAKAAFLGNIDGTARLMDRAIPLPLVGGAGLDALLGLIPFVGDAVSGIIAGSIVHKSLQYGLPKELVAKMVGNIFVDVLFGAIPILGDLFDLLFKANTRNVSLLRQYLAERDAAFVQS